MSLIEGDVEKFDRIYQKIKTYGPLLSILAYVAGIIYFFMLPHEQFIHRTYISENALLPGLVSSNINSNDILNKYHDLLKNHYESQKSNKIDLEFVRDLFVNGANVEAYVQHFNVTNPFLPKSNVIENGRNVYAFGRAQRADNTESIVITAPLYLRDDLNILTPNYIGVAQLFVMADLTKKHPYWSKDLVFVVYDEGQIGAQAWVNSYYDIKSDYILAEDLKKHAGSIQAALNLEFKDINIDKLELKIEGANGKLPNLDLFNTIIRICKTSQFQCSMESEKTLSYEESSYYHQPQLDHLTGVKNMALMVLKQATGVPTSSHGYFLNHRIEALTISGAKVQKRQNYKQNLLRVTRIVESTLRSINNLLERFHQSFFFYLLPSSNSYVSIGLYMPAFGLVALPILVQIINIWSSIFFKIKPKELKNIESVIILKKIKCLLEILELKLILITKSSILVYLFRIALPPIIVSFVFGLVLHLGTSTFIFYGKKFGLNPGDSLFNFYIAVTANILASPFLFKFKHTIGPEVSPTLKDYIKETGNKLTKLIILLVLVIVLGTLSFLNFSLAYLIALFIVPVAYITSFSFSNKFYRLIQIIISILASPIVYFSLLYAIYAYFYRNVDLTRNHLHLFKTIIGHFYDLALLSKLSNIWTYDLINLCLIPIWSAIWFNVFPKF